MYRLTGKQRQATYRNATGRDKADAATQIYKCIHRKEESIFRPNYTVFPLIDSVSNRNEYQDYLRRGGRGKGGWCVKLTNSHLPVALRVSPGLFRN